MHQALLRVLVIEQVNERDLKERRVQADGSRGSVRRVGGVTVRPARLGKAEPGRGNSQCLVGSRRPVWRARGCGACSRTCDWRGNGGVVSQVGPQRPLCSAWLLTLSVLGAIGGTSAQT